MKLEVIFLAALPAFAQGILGTSSSFSLGPDGAIRGSATFRVTSFLAPTVINAPYSGEQVFESVQTLADGTHITRSNSGPQQKVWRDSQGRVRTERTLGVRRDVEMPVIVEISDPVAGYVYVLDTVNKVAHRVHMEARPPISAAMRNRPIPPPPGAPPSMPGAASNSGAIAAPRTGGRVGFAGGGAAGAPRIASHSTTEQLGTKMIDGVLVSGARTTTIIPEGAQGNDRPMTTTTEMWMSKDLQLPILTVNYSPLSGTTTNKYANFSTADPDPSLFMVPSGYSIVDEKESFTLHWGEQ